MAETPKKPATLSSNNFVIEDQELNVIEKMLGVAFPEEFDIELTFKEVGAPPRVVRLSRRGGVAVRQFGNVIRESQATVQDRTMPA